MTVPSNIASRYLQRRVLLLSLIPLALLFAITVTLARTYHVREAGLVQTWYAKGNADLAAGRSVEAIEDFRNALAYDPENNLVQPRLAEALLADGRITEARSYFLNLWDSAPGSGEVNLDLAHISIRTADTDQAIHYFRSAIYGSWDKDPAQQRRKTRLELCEFLLNQGRVSDAKAEIAGLAADTPADDGDLLENVGQLFSQAEEPARALSEYEDALRINPQQDQWLEEAGKAAFKVGDYTKAETYLARADREYTSEEITGLRDTVRDVLDDDPFLPGLSDKKQAERSWRAFQQGLKRLGSCTGTGMGAQSPAETSPDLQALVNEAHGLKALVNLQSLARQSDLRNEAMQFVFRAEGINSPPCGLPDPADKALVLIARKHTSSIQ